GWSWPGWSASVPGPRAGWGAARRRAPPAPCADPRGAARARRPARGGARRPARGARRAAAPPAAAGGEAAPACPRYRLPRADSQIDPRLRARRGPEARRLAGVTALLPGAGADQRPGALPRAGEDHAGRAARRAGDFESVQLEEPRALPAAQRPARRPAHHPQRPRAAGGAA